MVKLNLNDVNYPLSLHDRRRPIDDLIEIYKASKIVDDEKDVIKLKLEKSPFEKQRNMTAPRGSATLQTQVSADMFEDFMTFAKQYNDEHNIAPTKKGEVNKSNPLKHIINEFLNSHVLERKCFEQIYIIMAFNILNIDNETLDNDNVECAVIGYIETPYNFTNLAPFQAVDDKYNKSRIIQALKHFDKDTLTMLNLKSINREVLFNIPHSIYNDFDLVCERLQMEHPQINFYDSYICMFNLNNYLDVLRDGVYVSKNSTYSHDGLVVMLDPDDIYMLDRIVARYTWSYNAGTFTFEFHVENYGDFNIETIYQAPRDVFVEYWNTSSGFLSQQAKLEMNLKHSRERVEDFSKSIEREERRQKKIVERLEALKNQ